MAAQSNPGQLVVGLPRVVFEEGGGGRGGEGGVVGG